MIEIRRTVTWREEIYHEFGPPAARPLVRGAVAAVLANPYAGHYEQHILPMMEALGAVGLDMGRQLLNAMDVTAERIESYGKGAIVGGAGELEHGALWHVPGGYAMRELLGWTNDGGAGRGQPSGQPSGPASAPTGGAASGQPSGQPSGQAAGQADAQATAQARKGNALAIVPSTKKVGPPGATLDVPLTHINASYVRGHFDTFSVTVPGAPAADELVVILVMAAGGRIHQRVGGLAASAISRWDGLR